MAISITIEFDCPRWLRRAFTVVGAPLLVLGASSAVLADVNVPHTFASKQVVSSQKINENFAALRDGINNAVPPGTIVAYGGKVVPDGWLLCDGFAKNQSAYPRLYTAIGTSFGPGDGSPGSFSLPDLKERFIRGASEAGQVGTKQEDATRLPTNPFVTDNSIPHTHAGTTVSAPSVGYGAGSQFTVEGLQTGPGGIHSHTITSGGDAETRPKNTWVNFIIKY